MAIEFKAWPKISRLVNERMTITEKIDGTNACVIFLPNDDAPFGFEYACQSRNKLITPESDNAGFAKWAYAHVDELYADLGFGYHYGEWWGSGIQRGYGMEKGQKFFSLFNAPRWTEKLEKDGPFVTPNLRVVPLLYTGPYSDICYKVEEELREHGSVAAPGYMNPEGIVLYLREANASYKITDAIAGQKIREPNE